MSQQQIHDFQSMVWDYFETHGRHDLPWRLPTDRGFDPYAIMVSEIMLQQTQVGRVIPKFQAFMKQFPTVQALASAPLSDVLQAWSGLGYNRRAKFLWQAAQQVVTDYAGVMPKTLEDLVRLPGIGKNTAGAIMAYAYDQPVYFIETNIRTVYIHHFFADETTVADKQLEPVIVATIANLDVGKRSARHWYWALMDYGTHLKQTVGNAGRKSTAYARQSTFEGSKRQIRGRVLALLQQPMSLAELQEYITDERLGDVLSDLTRESMISCAKDVYVLGSA